MNISDKYIRAERRETIAKTLGLTQPEMDQLEAYVDWAEESGTYYGRRDWFEKRHNKIKDRLGMPGDY